MLEDRQYGVALPVLEKLMADYPENFVFYVWASELFRRQEKNLEGANYFERLYAKHSGRSPLMAKYALLEKAGLQLAHARRAEALQTLQRIKSAGVGDRLLASRVQALEAEARKN
jgi:predicted Zn-dependent protease